MERKFVVGGHYEAASLYGGLLEIKVIERTEDTVTFVYLDDPEQTPHTKGIILQEHYDFDTLEPDGTLESLIAWSYIPAGQHHEEFGFYFADEGR